MRRVPCIIIGGLLIAICLGQIGCENDLRDVEKISSKKIEIPVDVSKGVTIIYSDSAVVKAKLIAPLVYHYRTQKPYLEMKEGVTVIFYDVNLKEKSRVTADYAIQRESEKLIELKKNVVATNSNGETFKSDELIWDESKRRFTSNQLVTIITKTQMLYGTGFEANENFYPWSIKQATGNFEVAEKQGF